MKKTKIILIAMMLSVVMSITAFGEDNIDANNTQATMNMAENQTGNIGPAYQKTKVMQARQMLDELYANETDPEIRKMAIDSSITSIFGISKDINTKLMSDGPLYVIGKYSQHPDYFNYDTYVVLGKDITYWLTNKELILTIDHYDENNFEKLQAVYSAAQELKQLTNDMCDQDKASYIHDYICDRLEYDDSLNQRSLAEAFCNGMGICNDYSGLFYLFGRYCGLNVKNERGAVKEPVDCYHSWNMVKVDGIWKQIDVTWDDTTKTRDYFLLDENAFENSRIAFGGSFHAMENQILAYISSH